MKKQIKLLLLLLCLQFSVSCQPKEDCEKCDEEAKTYVYKKSENDWISLYKQGENIAIRFSQNPSQSIPLEITEEGADYLMVSAKSQQKNTSGGSKIESQIKLVFQGENLEVSGLAPDNEPLIFERIAESYMTLFLPLRQRKIHTRIGQSAFIRDKNTPEDFYKNLAQVLCYYGVLYEEKEGKIYISTKRYYEEEELMWNYTTKAEDEKWLEAHPCENE